ncbi:MAG: hypothetical protein MZU97_18465 [Bacillus subtilis]|nr:hypothetical protein [Bacillus subtilis]
MRDALIKARDYKAKKDKYILDSTARKRRPKTRIQYEMGVARTGFSKASKSKSTRINKTTSSRRFASSKSSDSTRPSSTRRKDI